MVGQTKPIFAGAKGSPERMRNGWPNQADFAGRGQLRNDEHRRGMPLRCLSHLLAIRFFRWRYWGYDVLGLVPNLERTEQDRADEHEGGAYRKHIQFQGNVHATGLPDS
jgi:hypothetical protein